MPLLIAAKQHADAAIHPVLCYARLSAQCWCRAGLADGGKAVPAIQLPILRPKAPACNKGRINGQKRPLQLRHVWAIRVRLEIADNIRDLDLFNLAIDSKLRGRDLVRLKVRDNFVSGHMKERASVLQNKTQRPVQFEITEQTRKAVQRKIESPAMFGCDDLWPSRFHGSPHLSTRQYARILRGWVTSIGLERST
jgi:hypothetical protein